MKRMHSFQNGELMHIIYYQQEKDMVKQQNEVHAYIKKLEEQHESHGEEGKNDKMKLFGLQTFTCSQRKKRSELVKIGKDYRWKII